MNGFLTISKCQSDVTDPFRNSWLSKGTPLDFSKIQVSEIFEFLPDIKCINALTLPSTDTIADTVASKMSMIQ